MPNLHRSFLSTAAIILLLSWWGPSSAETGVAKPRCIAQQTEVARTTKVTWERELAAAAALEEQSTRIRATLAAMRKGDQDLRRALIVALSTCGIEFDHPDFAEFRADGRLIDQRNRELLKSILMEIDWPRISQFGPEADQSAFLIAQHSDTEPGFQEEVLRKLEPLVRVHETAGENYALLFDRVRIANAGLQRYGSQGKCNGQRWQPYPMEEPTQVSRRRRELGLPPMSLYARQVSRIYCSGQRDQKGDE
jgi:hypothetical protein